MHFPENDPREEAAQKLGAIFADCGWAWNIEHETETKAVLHATHAPLTLSTWLLKSEDGKPQRSWLLRVSTSEGSISAEFRDSFGSTPGKTPHATTVMCGGWRGLLSRLDLVLDAGLSVTGPWAPRHKGDTSVLRKQRGGAVLFDALEKLATAARLGCVSDDLLDLCEETLRSVSGA